MADYVVDAELRLQTQRAIGSLGGVLNRLSGVTSNLNRIATGYIGFQAISGAVRGAMNLITGFNSEIEGTRISLAAVFSATESIPFNQALEQTSSIFQTLRNDAIRSVATTQELFGIYQGILGPIRGAGGSLAQVRDITLSTVNAASALGVDFNQAQRDVMMMATGVAGADVKLFRMLRATGQIAENAQAFNDLSAPERIARLQQALNGFAGAADAYGRSWAGVTSTFMDIVSQLKGAFAASAFEKIKSFLTSINERLLGNRDRLESGLKRIGERVANILGEVFGRALHAFDYVMSHWDEIVAKIDNAIAKFREMAPMLAKAAVAFTALRAGLGVLSMVSTALSAISGVSSALGGLLGGGAAAAGGGAAAAAEGATVAAAAGGAEAAVATGAISTLSTALAPLAAILIPLAGLVVFLTEEWDHVKLALETFTPYLGVVQDLFGRIGEIFGTLWRVLKPILKLIGFLVFLIGIALGAALWAITKAFNFLLDLFQPLIDGIGQLGDAIGRFIDDVISRFFEFGERGRQHGRQLQLTMGEGSMEQPAAAEPSAAAVAGRGRTSNTTNFNGPINVRQEFREADPDRVAYDMIEDISRAAEHRVSSAFAPALTRG